MEARRVARTGVACLLVVAGVVAAWRGLVLASKASSDDLGGAVRYLTHVSTDKPIYRPGEKLYVRGVMLDAHDHKPLKQNTRLNALVQIRGPKGDVVASGYTQSQDSVIGFQWSIPKEQPGGEYRIKITYPSHGYAPAVRKFDIRAYRAPRLKSQIVFLRDGYGPGDTVGATLHVERAEGGFPAGAKVTAVARVDGAEVHKGQTKVDAQGNCSASFSLPKAIARGEGTLAMIIEDGGVVETATKTIPILLQTLDLTMYPEGGELIAGLPTRVYLEAKTPAKKPADIAGVVVDASGNLVTTYRTEHEGRGRFRFTPEKGGKYTLKITEPSGIRTTYPLPAVKDSGAIVSSVRDHTEKGAPVRLRVGTAAGGKITVTLSKREVEVSSITWEATAGVIADVVLRPPATADGVLRATVWDEKGTPLAERLVYRQPMKSLKISVTPDKSAYVPGGQATLTVTATDETGEPVSAVVGVTVTDDSVLEMIEKREQAPRLPVMVLLEDEVKELADAHVYLDEANPKAPLALDLLLGTQGWRRFAFVEAAKFITENGDAARRVLALRLPRPPPPGVVWRDAKGGRLGGRRPQRGRVVDEEMKAEGRAKDKVVEDARPEKKAPVPPKVAAPPKPRRPAEPPADKKRDVAAAGGPVLRKEQRQLQKAAEMAEVLADRDVLLRREAAAKRIRSDFIVVRVYAHAARADRRPGDRVDFTETLYWNAGVRTNANGEAKVSFVLNDSVTAFRVFADGFTADGALGQGTGVIESVEPFYIEPKLPLEVTAGDVIQLPISIVSGVGSDLKNVTLSTIAGRGIDVAAIDPFTLKANTRERRIVKIAVGDEVSLSDFMISAQAGLYSDKVTRKLRVAPLGFPVEVASGGMLEANAAIAQTVVIPESVVRGSVKTSIAVYPTPLANLTQALSRLLREPYGCFEQTSSTTYPLVMAQQYFLSHHGVDPAIVQRSHALLDRGYKRLVSFECKQQGYEWFGSDPGHEALSAYGLLEFTDMAQVRQVDSGMLTRTRDWLMKTRDGKGGFTRKRRALHRWIVDRDCSNAYILWSLLECGADGFEAELESLKKAAIASQNSYVHALSANVMALSGEKGTAKKLMDRLAASQTKDGWVDGATTSIVGSGGQALRIETTSLAMLAWLRDPAYAGAVEKGIRYLSEACKAGRYGSTQSTVLALRAIVAYDKARAKPGAKGTVQLFVDGRNVGAPAPFDKDTQGAITLTDIGEVLEPGEHRIELRMADGAGMPYSLAIDYHSLTPVSAKECEVSVQARLQDTKVAEGTVTEANVVVTNLAKDAVPMTVAIVGVPGGLEPRHDQLKELVKAGRIAAYEVIGREVVLYWRSLEPEQKIELPISLVAAVPGTYTGPASRAYLYYTDEFKHWADGLKITITPRAGK